MEESDFNLYVIAEMTYKKRHQEDANPFPMDWYSSKNYKLKTEIIAEALKNNIRVDETELYNNKFIERVRVKD